MNVKKMSHLTRYYMYEQVNKCLKENDYLPMKGQILGISGIHHFLPLIDMKNSEIFNANYPEVDMQNMPYDNNRFDFVISDQVIEHLENPEKAVRESYRVLKIGGVVIHTTCFINYIHSCPKDYWRFSTDALKYLCKDFSEILCSQGWGNRFAILLCFLSDKFRFARIPETKWAIRHFIANYNEDQYPIVTWVIARK